MHFKSKMLTACLFFVLMHLSLLAQRDSTIANRNELGLNVTSLLTDLLGNANLATRDKYLLTYKRLNKNGKGAFRTGIGILLSTSQSFVGSTEGELINQDINVRVGYEWRYTIVPRFQFYAGFDGLLGRNQEESETVSNNAVIAQKNTNNAFGFGPVLGFQFAIFNRLLVGTEGSLYATFSNSSVDFRVRSSSSSFQTPPSRSSNNFDLQTVSPTQLYIIVKF